MKRAAKKDLSHQAITDIIKELRDKWGVPIQFKDTHQLKGFGDFVFTFGGEILEQKKTKGFATISRGFTCIVEVKTGNKEITNDEWDYSSRCFGNYLVVTSFEELLMGIRILVRDEGLGIYEDMLRLDNIYHEKILKKKPPYDWVKYKTWGK